MSVVQKNALSVGVAVTGASIPLPAGAATLVLAAAATRIQVTLSAPIANTQPIYIGPQAMGAANGIELNPGDKIQFAVTAAIGAWVNAGAAQAVKVFVITK